MLSLESLDEWGEIGGRFQRMLVYDGEIVSKAHFVLVLNVVLQFVELGL